MNQLLFSFNLTLYAVDLILSPILNYICKMLIHNLPAFRNTDKFILNIKTLQMVKKPICESIWSLYISKYMNDKILCLNSEEYQ